MEVNILPPVPVVTLDDSLVDVAIHRASVYPSNIGRVVVIYSSSFSPPKV